jgi:hypothetical protein
MPYLILHDEINRLTGLFVTGYRKLAALLF